MAIRNGNLVRVGLLLVMLIFGWFTFQLYAELFTRLSVKKDASALEDKNGVVDDLDALIDVGNLELDEEWEEQKLLQPSVKKTRYNPCFTSVACAANEFSFKISTGAANVIGPSICINGSIIMKNSLSNVDRGMNVALLDGRTGKVIKTLVFDLYGKDSTEVKQFLKELKETEIIMITTSDDAAFKLDYESKELFAKLGSTHSKSLAFRDNWIFIGGFAMKKPSEFEQIIKNEKKTNKYGDWPAALTKEGCIAMLP